jgi:hypothetical protein
MLINSPNISGSLTVTGNATITGSLTVAGGINAAITGSATTASYVEYSNVANKPTLVSGSSQVSFNGITDKPTLVSGSTQVSFNGITDKPTLVSGSSQITYSGLSGIPSGIVSGSSQVAALGFATTGSNTFQANQVITGSLFISQNLVVAGSSSIQYISSSVVDIADNIITVNAFNPGVRFGGLAVADSGSSPRVSGSILFDSIKDQWIFVHENSATTSSVLLMGPETYNDLGNESYLSANRLPKGSGVEHLRDSNISDTGTVVSINSNTAVTGSLRVTSTGTFSSTITSLVNNISADGAGVVLQGYVDNSLRIAVRGSGYNDGARGGLLASTGDFSSTVTATGNVRSINGGVDGTFQDAFVGVYSGNNNEQNSIQTAVSSGASQSGFRLQVSNGGGSSGRTTVVDFLRDRQLFYTNVGIGTTTPGTRLEISSTAPIGDRTLPHNILTLTAEQGNAPYGGFGGAILFKNRSYVSGLVESSRIRSVIYDDGTPNNFGGGLWFETTPTPGGTLTPSVVINYQGRVGVGTTSPEALLHLSQAATGGNGAFIFIDNPASSTLGNTAGIRFATNSGASFSGYGSSIEAVNTNNSDGAEALTFSTWNGASRGERMRITSAGAVTKGSQPFAMGALASNQSISASTFTPLAFQTNQGFYGVNTGGCWNNSTYTFTAPVTGVYIVNVSLLTNSLGQVALFVNGTRKHSIPSWYVSSSVTWGGSALIPLTAGEALTLQGYGNAGIVEANIYHTFFSIYLLG